MAGITIENGSQNQFGTGYISWEKVFRKRFSAGLNQEIFSCEFGNAQIERCINIACVPQSIGTDNSHIEIASSTFHHSFQPGLVMQFPVLKREGGLGFFTASFEKPNPVLGIVSGLPFGNGSILQSVGSGNIIRQSRNSV